MRSAVLKAGVARPLAVVLALLPTLAGSAGAFAADYPVRLVRMFLPTASCGTPQAFRDLIEREIKRWGEVIRKAGIRAD